MPMTYSQYFNLLPEIHDDIFITKPIYGTGCDDRHFTCSNGECLHPDYICDGIIHCIDGGDDENNCTNIGNYILVV